MRLTVLLLVAVAVWVAGCGPTALEPLHPPIELPGSPSKPVRPTEAPAPPASSAALATSTAALEAAPSPPATPSADVGPLRLASYRRIDDRIDSMGYHSQVHIVDRDMEVRARGNGIQRLDVYLTLSARDTAARGTGAPDSDGEVAVQLHPPEAGVTYAVEGPAVLSDQRPEQMGDTVNEHNELILRAGGFLVMAEEN